MTHPEIPGYRHLTTLQVRFADLDVNSHLNHAKYLTFMEHARLEYTAQVIGVSFTPLEKRPQTRMILASIQCRLPAARSHYRPGNRRVFPLPAPRQQELPDGAHPARRWRTRRLCQLHRRRL